MSAWFCETTENSDVVCSTRVRLARNISNFPFVKSCSDDELQEIQNLIFSAFDKIEKAEKNKTETGNENNPNTAETFRCVPIKSIDTFSKAVFVERGILDLPLAKSIVFSEQKDLHCLVATKDHLRIATFRAGLDAKNAFDECKQIDERLQKYLQFCASYDFGYLTQGLCDAGSGMKISCRVHLPCMQDSGECEKYFAQLKEKGFAVSSPYGVGGRTEKSLGAFYQINTAQAQLGSEKDQVDCMTETTKEIIEVERKIRNKYAENKKTILKNIILRSFALAKFSVMLSWRESVDIISDLKLGVDLGIIDGVSSGELFSLLFETGEGHLSYLLHTADFSFESDIVVSIEKKLMRLRAICVQKVVDKMRFTNQIG